MVDLPLLVIGGRTTGLMMAAELARHGVPVRIIDKSPGIDPHARATGIHSRTLEILDNIGIAQRFVELGQPVRSMRIFANGEFVGEMCEDAVDSPFPNGIALSQAKTEAILEEHLGRLGVKVERETELIALEEHDSGVRATVRHANGKEEIIETPWLLGCDGAHSTVRHLTGTAFVGEEDPIPFHLADVRLGGPRELDEVHVYLHEEGVLFLFSLDEGRCLVASSGKKGDKECAAPTLEQMKDIIARRSQRDFHLSDPRWLAGFRIHYRLVPHYRQGRTFLAGDAAHVHSPVGGHGMNTGIQDAYNLAWKMALVQRGVVPETWLESYEIERRQVAEGVIAFTKMLTQADESFAELSAQDRQSLCEHLIVPASQKQRMWRAAEELDLDYRTSPICVEPEGEFDDGPHAGCEVFDAGPIRVQGRQCRFFDLLRGTHHRLVLWTGLQGAQTAEQVVSLASSAMESHGHWIDAFIACPQPASVPVPDQVTWIEDPECSLHKRYGADSANLYLIRPDGYVAYRSKRLDSLKDYLARVF